MGRGPKIAITLLAGVLLMGQGGPPPRAVPIKPLVTELPPATPRDGRVAGLGEGVMVVLRRIKASNVVPLRENEALLLRDAVMADGAIDSAERDLLDEMINPQVRSVLIADPAAGGSSQIVFYPFFGKAREIVMDTIEPPIDFASAWAGGNDGWRVIVEEASKGGYRESRAEIFVTQQLERVWNESNLSNSYKPYRDEVIRLYSASMALSGAQVVPARQLLFNASNRLDEQRGDAIPDYLYNWIKPADAT
jgi:hypothetical protein